VLAAKEAGKHTKCDNRDEVAALHRAVF